MPQTYPPIFEAIQEINLKGIRVDIIKLKAYREVLSSSQDPMAPKRLVQLEALLREVSKDGRLRLNQSSLSKFPGFNLAHLGKKSIEGQTMREFITATPGAHLFVIDLGTIGYSLEEHYVQPFDNLEAANEAVARINKEKGSVKLIDGTRFSASCLFDIVTYATVVVKEDLVLNLKKSLPRYSKIVAALSDEVIVEVFPSHEDQQVSGKVNSQGTLEAYKKALSLTQNKYQLRVPLQARFYESQEWR